MAKTAIFWIRDGVLVDRMHVNPVAFAIACLQFANPVQFEKTSLISLIGFAFNKSGFSCADKIRKYNKEQLPLVTNVAGAVDCYNLLATEAAKSCNYFTGASELLHKLKSLGYLNFITSAVEQNLLDVWAQSEQGRELAPALTEILGKRPDLNKGQEHYAYVREQFGAEKIIYVADAVSEISNAALFATRYGILPIGFAHVITVQRVSVALKLVKTAYEKYFPAGHLNGTEHLRVAALQIQLPDQTKLSEMLTEAGALEVVGGEAGDIFSNLDRLFDRLSRTLTLPQSREYTHREEDLHDHH